MKSEVPEVFFESLDLAAAVGVIGGKWKVRIICLLLGETKRFGELRRSLTGVHRGTLTYELRGLETDGIIQRTQYMTIPPTVEYKLTARGAALKPVILALSRLVRAVNQTSTRPSGRVLTGTTNPRHRDETLCFRNGVAASEGVRAPGCRINSREIQVFLRFRSCSESQLR